MEHILLNRIKERIIDITSKENAGFKPRMQCQMQLQTMVMRIEQNIYNGKETYIIAQDVKSGYNNVKWEDVLNIVK